MSDIDSFDLGAGINAIKAKRDAAVSRPSRLAERRADEIAAQRAVDGRVADVPRQKGQGKNTGHIQLNVRVPVELKNRVVEAARVMPDGDMSKVVVAALNAYFKRKDA